MRETVNATVSLILLYLTWVGKLGNCSVLFRNSTILDGFHKNRNSQDKGSQGKTDAEESEEAISFTHACMDGHGDTGSDKTKSHQADHYRKPLGFTFCLTFQLLDNDG